MSNRAEKRAAAWVRKVRREDRMADKKSLEHMAARITELEMLLERAYRFVSPNYDPLPISNTQMAAEIRRVLGTIQSA